MVPEEGTMIPLGFKKWSLAYKKDSIMRSCTKKTPMGSLTMTSTLGNAVIFSILSLIIFLKNTRNHC